MNPLAELCRVWFALTLVLMLIVVGILTHTADLVYNLGLIAELTRQDFAVCTAAIFFRGFLLANPQIRIKQFDMDWAGLAASCPAMVLMNHASFFDFFLFTAMLPVSVCRTGHVRTVMSASLTKIPIVGKSIGDHAGSFKVFFQAKGAGFGKGDATDYSVDREKQQAETDRMEHHISELKGVIAFCPEGGMNKTPEEGLKPFRRGSFAQAAKYATPIYGAVLTGCTAAWPRDAKIGGCACTCHRARTRNGRRAARCGRSRAALERRALRLPRLLAALGATPSDAMRAWPACATPGQGSFKPHFACSDTIHPTMPPSHLPLSFSLRVL